MAKIIKKVTLNAPASTSTGVDPTKGTQENPYTWDEFEYLFCSWQWNGGWVEGFGNVPANICGSSFSSSHYNPSDLWWPEDEAGGNNNGNQENGGQQNNQNGNQGNSNTNGGNYNGGNNNGGNGNSGGNGNFQQPQNYVYSFSNEGGCKVIPSVLSVNIVLAKKQMIIID